ncbi:MAG: hypothetical protein KIT72_03220 [Polyangiaceae bacterium]|nr:hypothetical protein [Polyangiaceae bacterium]MCW5789411.1 hypothetical protein [Polyangiaceae bacterium]
MLDADAFRCLHGLKLLDLVLSALARMTSVSVTEYIARHELNLLSREIGRLESSGLLRVEIVIAGSAAGKRFREFRRVADKGEAEAIAWALDFASEERPLFVTRDKGATRFAQEQRVPVTDVLGAIVEACELGELAPEVARQALVVWDDPQVQLCRPAQYTGLDAEWARRVSSRAAWA